VNVQKPKVFQLQEASPPDLLTRGSAPGSRWELRPQTPIIRASLYLGGELELSNAGTDKNDKQCSFHFGLYRIH